MGNLAAVHADQGKEAMALNGQFILGAIPV
jgi:hypothetical protein